MVKNIIDEENHIFLAQGEVVLNIDEEFWNQVTEVWDIVEEGGSDVVVGERDDGAEVGADTHHTEHNIVPDNLRPTVWYTGGKQQPREKQEFEKYHNPAWKLKTGFYKKKKAWIIQSINLVEDQ